MQVEQESGRTWYDVERSLDIAACAERHIEHDLARLPEAERVALVAARSTRLRRSRGVYGWNRFIDLACDTEDFIVWSGGSGTWRNNTRADCSMVGTVEVAYWVDAYVHQDPANQVRKQIPAGFSWTASRLDSCTPIGSGAPPVRRGVTRTV